MSTTYAGNPSRRILDTHDRASEVLFGLIMVLTFTGSLSVAEAGRDDVRAMWIGALGCNLAWGVIDAILYWMGCAAEKGQSRRVHRALRISASPATATQVVVDALPEWVASTLKPEELQSIQERLVRQPEPPAQASLSREDWLGGIGVFLIVFTSMFPVVLPFLVLEEVSLAMRTSNAVALAMLFLTGYAYGTITSRHPWLLGVGMVLLGSALVGMTIALGG